MLNKHELDILSFNEWLIERYGERAVSFDEPLSYLGYPFLKKHYAIHVLPLIRIRCIAYNLTISYFSDECHVHMRLGGYSGNGPIEVRKIHEQLSKEQFWEKIDDMVTKCQSR